MRSPRNSVGWAGRGPWTLDFWSEASGATEQVSLKASEIFMTLDAYRRLAGQIDQPLHLGITEAGGLRGGEGGREAGEVGTRRAALVARPAVVAAGAALVVLREHGRPADRHHAPAEALRDRIRVVFQRMQQPIGDQASDVVVCQGVVNVFAIAARAHDPFGLEQS